MLGSETEVIEKIFFIKLSVPSLDCLVWNRGKLFVMIYWNIFFYTLFKS